MTQATIAFEIRYIDKKCFNHIEEEDRKEDRKK